MSDALDLVWVALFLATLGLVPAVIAHAKGRSFRPWWLFGTVAFIPALVIALVLRRGDIAPLWGRWGLASSPQAALRLVPVFLAINILAVTSHNDAVKVLAIVVGCGVLHLVVNRLVREPAS